MSEGTMHMTEDELNNMYHRFPIAVDNSGDASQTKSKHISRKEQTELVNNPRHYQWLREVCGIEPIDICRHLNFNRGNALKYLIRAGRKHEEGYTDLEKEISDIKKALWYLQDELNQLIDKRSNESKN